MSAPDPNTPIFGRTDEGFTAAALGELAWIAIPGVDGFHIVSAWRIGAPMRQWKRRDFWAFGGHAADEAGFRAYVENVAEHHRQLPALGRRPCESGVWTPWGFAQHGEIYGEGVVFFTTASHGGFKLAPERLALMPAALRAAGGWYEEDCEWAKVAIAFPDLFTESERREAERTLRHWSPACWEAVRGRQLESTGTSEKGDANV